MGHGRGGFDEPVVSFAGLIDAFAGKVTHGSGNFKIERLIHSGLSSLEVILER